MRWIGRGLFLDFTEDKLSIYRNHLLDFQIFSLFYPKFDLDVFITSKSNLSSLILNNLWSFELCISVLRVNKVMDRGSYKICQMLCPHTFWGTFTLKMALFENPCHPRTLLAEAASYREITFPSPFAVMAARSNKFSVQGWISARVFIRLRLNKFEFRRPVSGWLSSILYVLAMPV